MHGGCGIPGSAVRAKLESRKYPFVAVGAFHLACVFNRDHAENFLKGCQSGLKFFKSVFLHQAHSITAGCHTNLLHISRGSNQGADDVAHPEQFVDADAALVAGLVALFTADGNGHFGRRFGRPCLDEPRAKLFCGGLDGMTGAKLPNQALR